MLGKVISKTIKNLRYAGDHCIEKRKQGKYSKFAECCQEGE